MADPVVASDGHTYERSAIVEWFRQGRLFLSGKDLSATQQGGQQGEGLRKKKTKLLSLLSKTFRKSFLFRKVNFQEVPEIVVVRD